jgi:hypothetical protein
MVRFCRDHDWGQGRKRSSFALSGVSFGDAGKHLPLGQSGDFGKRSVDYWYPIALGIVIPVKTGTQDGKEKAGFVLAQE